MYRKQITFLILIIVGDTQDKLKSGKAWYFVKNYWFEI